MKGKKHIEEEVGKTLECFDSFEQIEPGPFFAARVQANIEALERQRTEKTPFLTVGRLRPALIAVMLVLNLLSAATVMTLFRSRAEQTGERAQYLAAVTEEYALNQNDYYLYLSQ